MDLKIEIYIWDIGYDEGEELAIKMADVLDDRGYGARHVREDESEILCLVVGRRTDLPHSFDGEQETDDGVPVGLAHFLDNEVFGEADPEIIIFPGAGEADQVGTS